MKNVKMGLFALASILGVTSAFTNVSHKPTGTTYFSVTDNAGGYNWQTATPAGACQAPKPSGLSAFCTIVTKAGFVPSHNTVPPAANCLSRTNANQLYR